VKACIAVGIPFLADFNGKEGTIGVSRISKYFMSQLLLTAGLIHLTVTYVDKNYKRVSAETAYLTPDVLSRPNLTVAINATVTRVLFDTTQLKPRAIGVEFGTVESGPRWEAFAKKEVILSYAFFLFKFDNKIPYVSRVEEAPYTLRT